MGLPNAVNGQEARKLLVHRDTQLRTSWPQLGLTKAWPAWPRYLAVRSEALSINQLYSSTLHLLSGGHIIWSCIQPRIKSVR